MEQNSSVRSRASITLLALAVLLGGCVRPPNVQEPRPHPLAQRSRILASDGSELATLFTENRETVSLKDIPRVMQEAVVATEDQRFWSHKGFDAKAITRAAIRNAATGAVVQGGSTITQQYVKNIYFPVNRPRTLQQKVIEAQLALKLEKEHSKQEILERYLNTVYFGDGAYGVKAAAEQFFRKHVSQLDLQQAALLAGLIQAPESYQPRRVPEVATRRRNHVLDRMSILGMISQNEAESTKAMPLGITDPPLRSVREPFLVEFVKQSIISNPAFGQDEADRANLLFQGGVDVHTSFDPKLQDIARRSIARVFGRPDDPEVALVALDPQTGKIVAMVGGRDFATSQVNLALGKAGGGSGRQAGSAFKPFVLAAAFEDGKRANSVYSSSGVCIRRRGHPAYCPRNSEGGGGGPMTLESATINSVNTVFVRLGADIGNARVAGMAKRMGITHRLLSEPSLPLGSMEVSPLDMASAFGTIANYGTHIPPSPLLRVDLPEGGDIQPKPPIRRALDPGAAWLVTDVLRKVIERGTGTRAQIGRPAAGKTGTSQNYADAWFVGYTPELVTAVWVGYPQGQLPMNNVRGIRVFGGTFPAMIWRLFMEEALADSPILDFELPQSDMITIHIDPSTGLLAGPHCAGSQEVKMLRQLAPTQTCPAPPPAPAPVTSSVTSTTTDTATPSPSPETSPSPSPAEPAPSPSPSPGE